MSGHTSSTARVGIVTGAASGLGEAVVEALHDAGWEVAGFDLRARPGCSVVDVADAAHVAEAVQEVVGRHGRLDGVVSCAATYSNSLAPVHLVDDTSWTRTLAVNLTGAFNVAKATLAHLVETKGSMVFVASGVTRAPQPGGAAYSASKAGVASLARSVALEYAQHGVRANAVSPGYMDTPMTAPALARPDLREVIEDSIPLGRVASTAEVASLIRFLITEATYITGEEIHIEGGGLLNVYSNSSDVDRMWERISRRRAHGTGPQR